MDAASKPRPPSRSGSCLPYSVKAGRKEAVALRPGKSPAGMRRQAVDRHLLAQRTRTPAGAIAYYPAPMRICSTPIALLRSSSLFPLRLHHLDGRRRRGEGEIEPAAQGPHAPQIPLFLVIIKESNQQGRMHPSIHTYSSHLQTKCKMRKHAWVSQAQTVQRLISYRNHITHATHVPI